jgi:anti-sigma28 factor (negative regulator of flagellin synthesis)
MRTHELKLRIQRADYQVDPAVVAEAMLRHAVSLIICC